MMKHLKLFENFNKGDIDHICKKYEIENYTINEDGTIDVDGNVNLDNRGLTELPPKFRNVGGHFYCGNNQLTNLKGCPKSIGGDFICSNNQLKSLEGCPENVSGNFYCSNNNITSFEGLPYSIGGKLYCGNNPIFNIWKLFIDYSKIELFNDYDIIRGTDIVLYRLNSFLDEIGKYPVEKVDGYNNI